MIIAQVANFYGPRSGGIRTMMHHLGVGYREAGHESVLIVPGEAHDEFEAPHGRVIVLPGRRLPLSGGYRVITDVDAVCTALGGIGPDRIEVSDRATLRNLGWWARANGIPSVMWAHERVDGVLRAWLPGPWPVEGLADRWNLSTATRFDRVVCSTAYALEEYERIGWAAVAQVPLGVDLATFHPGRRDESLRSDLLGDDADTLLITCTRLSREKRPDLAIDAVRRLRSDGHRARLVMLGSGPMEGTLRRQASGLPVTFLGYVSERERVADILASADVTIAPGPIETFGLAALESLACGTPVVASDTSALREIVDGRAGLAVDCTGESFADGAAELLGRPEPTRRLAARARARMFPWSATVESMLRLHGIGNAAGSEARGRATQA